MTLDSVVAMHSRASLSKPSPKRSLSSAGLDDLEELLHDSDNGQRKRHQSFSNNVNHYEASAFGAPLSPSSQHEYTPHPTSYSSALHRPDLPVYSKKMNTSAGFQLLEARYPNQASMSLKYRNSLLDDNNFADEQYQDLDNDFQASEDASSLEHKYKVNRHHLSSPVFASQDQQDATFEHRLKPQDHSPLVGKRFDHNSFLSSSQRSYGSESSPREEFLVQAFGPSGFKLHSASVSSNDDLEDSLSDDSSGNNQESAMTDADNELKMSFNELEADIRGSMHQLSPQHHSARLPELTEMSHQAFAAPSHGLYGLPRHVLSQTNQDLPQTIMFTQPLDRSHGLGSQKVAAYYPRDTQQSFLAKTVPHKGNQHGMQVPTKWLRDEDERLRVAVARYGGKNWKMIAETLGNGRTDVQCLHRWNKVLKPGLIKGPWTPEEDRILTSLITRYGVGKIRWCDLALHLPGRIGKQCRERWCNHLDSRIRKGQWTAEEDDMVFRWQQKLGNKWSEIAKLLPGRTENAVKNRFNSAARRKWLMHQANKAALPSTSQSTPSTPPPSLPQPSHGLGPPPSTHPRGEGYNVTSLSYGSEKISPLPASEGLLEHHADHIMSTLGRQNPTPPPNEMLPTYAQHEHDKGTEVGKMDALLLGSSSTFVPPSRASLFPSPPPNRSHTIHSLTSSPTSGESASAPVFPLPVQFSALAPGAGLPHESTSGEEDSSKASVLHLKDEKIERSNEDLQVTSVGQDASVSMDDENMNSFLDSVALELEDIMK